jgi:hypothetical protein
MVHIECNFHLNILFAVYDHMLSPQKTQNLDLDVKETHINRI